MKKIITLVFMSAVLALTSCNDFLDKYPKYGVDPESEVTNEIAVALTTAATRLFSHLICITSVFGASTSSQATVK